MRYVSTRGSAPVLGFADVLLAGLARDGGLYVPEAWPTFSREEIRSWQRLDYAGVATRVLAPFVGDDVPADDLAAMAAETYAAFDHPAVAPLVQLDANLWVQELFHGPTLAFKDMALQLVGRLFDHVLSRRGQRITILGATSGDTGPAGIEAVRGSDSVEIVMLHPHGRTSEVQRRQMTTVTDANVHNVAIEGSFDDCQDIVKAAFADADFRDRMALSAVNSINWARVAAQMAYYADAATRLGAPDRSLAFAVPTGNFGNVLAADGLRRCGLPVERLIIGSNANDILPRFFEADDMSLRTVEPSLSPSMDIQVSSNFERLLFEMYDRDGAAVAEVMTRFRRDGRLAVGADRLAAARTLYRAARFDDEATLAGIDAIRRRTGYLADPHSAIGILAAIAGGEGLDCPIVAMATAHPAKFPDAVERACGIRPELPPHLADLLDRPERMTVLPADAEVVKAWVGERLPTVGGNLR